MNDNSKWKRKLPGRIYDYNYKVSEHYYKPQTDFIDGRSLRRQASPCPEAQSYAERFATTPWYGETRGLPYDPTKSILKTPVFKPSETYRRGPTPLRELKDNEDVPLNVRFNRRRRKAQAQEEELGIVPRSRKADEEELDEDIFRPSRRALELREEIRRLDEDLSRTEVHLSSDRATSHKSGGKLEDTLSPSLSSRLRRAQRDAAATVVAPSLTSSRPPRPHSRRSAAADDFPSTSYTSRPRTRVDSIGEASLASYGRSYRSSSITRDEGGSGTVHSRAQKLREEKRAKESEDLTEHIHKMVEKMRVREVDPEEAYRARRDLRASSLDPYEKDTRVRSRQRARVKTFVYGVGH